MKLITLSPLLLAVILVLSLNAKAETIQTNVENFTCNPVNSTKSDKTFTAVGHIVHVNKYTTPTDANPLGEMVVFETLQYTTRGIVSAIYKDVVLQGVAFSGNDEELGDFNLLHGDNRTTGVASFSLDMTSNPSDHSKVSKIKTLKGNTYLSNCR